MKKVLPLLLVFILTLPAGLSAQETVPLSLEDAVAAALTNNTEIAIAQFDKESAIARFRQSNAVFLPQIRLSYSALSTNNPLNAFGFKLQQEAIAQSDFAPEVLNNPSGTPNFLTKAEWQQPLLNLDAMQMRKAAHQEIYAHRFKIQRTKEHERKIVVEEKISNRTDTINNSILDNDTDM